MKKLFCKIAFSVFLLTSVTSCSKGKITRDTRSEVAIISNNAASNNNRIIPATTGSISGTLVPAPIKSVIIAFNEITVSDEVAANADGTFILTALPVGTYHLAIKYVLPNGAGYMGKFVDKVFVMADSVTNLGIIEL